MEVRPMNIFILFFVSIALVACSSSSSTDIETNTNNPPSSASDKNVAAATNASTVTTTFPSGNETLVTDGDTSTTGSWAGAAVGDWIKVAFDKTYSISTIRIFTNNTSFNVNGGVTTDGLRVFISNDDVTYSEVAVALGSSAPVTCSSLSLGSGKIECGLSQKQDARYIRVALTTDFFGTEIYEIEVMGS